MWFQAVVYRRAEAAAAIAIASGSQQSTMRAISHQIAWRPTRVRAVRHTACDACRAAQAQDLRAIRKRIVRDLASLLTAAVEEILDRHSQVVPCSVVVCYGLTMLLSGGGESASTADDQLRRKRTDNGEETS
jgi:predicted component of type VI protein secretion system